MASAVSFSLAQPASKSVKAARSDSVSENRPLAESWAMSSAVLVGVRFVASKTIRSRLLETNMSMDGLVVRKNGRMRS